MEGYIKFWGEKLEAVRLGKRMGNYGRGRGQGQGGRIQRQCIPNRLRLLPSRGFHVRSRRIRGYLLENSPQEELRKHPVTVPWPPTAQRKKARLRWKCLSSCHSRSPPRLSLGLWVLHTSLFPWAPAPVQSTQCSPEQMSMFWSG